MSDPPPFENPSSNFLLCVKICKFVKNYSQIIPYFLSDPSPESKSLHMKAAYPGPPTTTTTTTTMAPPRYVGPLNATCECKCFGITVPTTPTTPTSIKVLVRKEVGNPSNYFDKTFAEYKEGFSAKGLLKQQLIFNLDDL